MAVRLAESLLACGGFDLADILNRYLAWWREGAFDTGPVSARALALVAAGMPVARRRSQAARPAGPDNKAMARASTSPHGAPPAAWAIAACNSSRHRGLPGSVSLASRP